MFVGRKNELLMLEQAYNSPKSELAVIYGRRCIGKSSLIKEFSRGKDNFYSFEALENNNTESQINHFVDRISVQMEDPLIKRIKFNSWHDVFNFLTSKVIRNSKRKKKLLLFFDELQWMAVRKSSLVSLIKYYWDNQWKEHNVMLILCGSIASFMVDKVVNSKALYGRMTLELHLGGLKLDEAAMFFGKGRSKEEIVKYISVFGTVPKYLEMIDTNRSFDQNMNKLCFSKNAIMISEIEKIFYSQFQEAGYYVAIVECLKTGMKSLKDIAQKTGLPSGGGLTRYINNLEKADIIKSHVPWDKSYGSRNKKYTISDEFLNFYFKYIEPNKKDISISGARNLFKSLTGDSFNVWLGFAFEKLCLKHSWHLAEKMGFGEEVATSGSLFSKDSERFQIDLLYKRFDKVVTICEIKHHKNEVTAEVIKDVERKKKLLKIPRGYSLETALISLYGPDKSLRKSEYFNHYITLDDLF